MYKWQKYVHTNKFFNPNSFLMGKKLKLGYHCPKPAVGLSLVYLQLRLNELQTAMFVNNICVQQYRFSLINRFNLMHRLVQ